MILKVSKIEKNMSCVYKILYPNGKVYIGCSQDLRRRMWEHNNSKRRRTLNDEAIALFGVVEEVEILFMSEDKKELEEKEAYFINKYDATNIDKGYNVSKYGSAWGRKGDLNPLTKISDDKVLEIRNRKMSGESKKNVYKDYKNIIGIYGFEYIWEGNTRLNIAPDIIDYFNKYDKSEKISIANKGENNGRATISTDDVRRIRSLYDEGLKMTEINKIYLHLSYTQLRRICKRETWKHVK